MENLEAQGLIAISYSLSVSLYLLCRKGGVVVKTSKEGF